MSPSSGHLAYCHHQMSVCGSVWNCLTSYSRSHFFHLLNKTRFLGEWQFYSPILGDLTCKPSYNWWDVSSWGKKVLNHDLWLINLTLVSRNVYWVPPVLMAYMSFIVHVPINPVHQLYHAKTPGYQYIKMNKKVAASFKLKMFPHFYRKQLRASKQCVVGGGGFYPDGLTKCFL